jgi:acyl carrier protein
MDVGVAEGKFTEIMREVFNRPDLQYSPELTAAEVEEWDSLSHVDLIVAVESEFKIRLSTGEVRGLKNVGQFVALIAAKAK